MDTREPSARELDALFSMRSVDSPADAAVQRALGEVKAALMREPDPAFVASFAGHLATVAACAADAPRAVEPVRARRGAPRSPWVRRAVSALAVAAASAGLVAGAAAANEAAPGDVLYGVDQVLERVGILDGGIDERFDEAQALLDAGAPEAALRHALQALVEEGYPEAALALDGAEGSGAPGVGPGDVESFVAWLLAQDRGPGFGQEVALRARDLGVGADGVGADGVGGNGHGPAPQATEAPPPPHGGDGVQPGTPAKPGVKPEGDGAPGVGTAPQATQVPNPPQTGQGGNGGGPAPQATQVPNPPQTGQGGNGGGPAPQATQVPRDS